MGNYTRVCCFEGKNVFIENNEKRNEEDKGSEEERIQERHEPARLRKLFI